MSYIFDEIKRSVGPPRELGGIPLDEIGATGFGVSECAEIAKEYINLDLNGTRLVVEGFGNERSGGMGVSLGFDEEARERLCIGNNPSRTG